MQPGRNDDWYNFPNRPAGSTLSTKLPEKKPEKPKWGKYLPVLIGVFILVLLTVVFFIFITPAGSSQGVNPATTTKAIVTTSVTPILHDDFPTPEPPSILLPGTGVKRADLQGVFEKSYNFTFGPKTQLNGQLSNTGKASKDPVSLQLIGPDNDLKQIILSYTTGGGDLQVDYNQSMIYMISLLRNVSPAFPSPTIWLSGGLVPIVKNQTYSKSFEKLRFDLNYKPPQYILSVQPN